MAIDKLLNVSFQELFDPATVTDRVRVKFSGSWDIANLSTTLKSTTLQYVKPSESTLQLNTESGSADMNSATLAANAGLMSRRGSVFGTLNTNVNFNTFSFPSSSAFGVYDGVGGLEIAFFSGSVQYNDAVTGSAEITSPGVNNFNLLGITASQPNTIFEWTASNGTDVNQIQISYLLPITASILPANTTSSFSNLSGAGVPIPSLSAGVLYNFKILQTNNSTPSYFTVETVKNSNGYYNPGTVGNAIGTYDLTGGSVISLITSSYISSVVIAGSSNLTSSYKFTPTNNIIASSSLLRSTGDVSLEIY